MVRVALDQDWTILERSAAAEHFFHHRTLRACLDPDHATRLSLAFHHAQGAFQLPDLHLVQVGLSTLPMHVQGHAHNGAATLFFQGAERVAEPANLRLEERYQLLLESGRMVMWEWNAYTRSVRWMGSWQELLGYNPHEMPPNLEFSRNLMHPDDEESTTSAFYANVEGHKPHFEAIYRLRHREGHYVHFLGRGRVIDRDAGGRPIRFLATGTDITAQRRAEIEAKRMADHRAMFLATVSHEIRTPLHGMLGALDLALDRPLADDVAELLQVVRDTGDDLQALTNDILQFTKLDRGASQADAHTFDLGDLLEHVRNMFHDRARLKGVSFRLSPRPEAPLWVHGDSHRLKQILNNLVSNAVKFTDQGSIELSWERKDANILFRLTDTGRGIRDPSTIFEPFRQDDASVTRTHGGTGLGLAIVDRLVHTLHGHIHLDSTPGKGTTFEVSLPLPAIELSEPSVRRPSGRAHGPEDGQPLRLLIAEDNPLNQLIFEKYLHGSGHHLKMVSNGQEALQACARSTFDVIVLDLHMPIMGGLDTLKRLRDAGRTTWAIAATADAYQDTERRCLDLGFDAFLAKPFTKAQLLDSLSQARIAQAV